VQARASGQALAPPSKLISVVALNSCSLKILTVGHDADVEDASGGENPGAQVATPTR
jgi:hypothetical protein